ncbi:succinate dehydrogenase assembly factor 4, mitochondrial-like [Condylostylus longicornis]|uniref:succinate dehydrogenase assembly factor 4, mitochondrial-like n=1 Tax=Condylostylus longicornis TaxID=2530218 RepID=UPI00244DEA89|nr:succinate dehydrogenase assembly factor 4, mitochondrial-like [Condylostylus longicornis]
MSNIMQGAASKTRIISQVTKQASTCYATTANFDVTAKNKYDPAAFTSLHLNYSVNEKSLLTRFKNYMSSQRNKDNDPFKPWPKSLNPYTGECGGPTGPEPTRYGDWERKGRCSDF